MTKIPCALLVDDDDTANYLNEMLFKKMDAAESLLVARNGQEALTLINQHCPGQGCPTLILLDIKMPVMDGFEFLEAYHKLEIAQKQSMVIIMLTTSLNPNDLEKVKRADVAGIINKPLTKKALEDIITRHFA